MPFFLIYWLIRLLSHSLFMCLSFSFSFASSLVLLGIFFLDRNVQRPIHRKIPGSFNQSAAPLDFSPPGRLAICMQIFFLQLNTELFKGHFVFRISGFFHSSSGTFFPVKVLDSVQEGREHQFPELIHRLLSPSMGCFRLSWSIYLQDMHSFTL